MRIPPRLAACALAFAAVVLVMGGLVLDRIAGDRHVAAAGPLWLYPFLVVTAAGDLSRPELIRVANSLQDR